MNITEIDIASEHGMKDRPFRLKTIRDTPTYQLGIHPDGSFWIYDKAEDYYHEVAANVTGNLSKLFPEVDA